VISNFKFYRDQHQISGIKSLPRSVTNLIPKPKFLLLSLASCCIIGIGNAQYTTDKVVGEKHKVEADSLKASVYPHTFPILGKKAVAQGFKLPKSAGFSAQYLYQQSDIIIENLSVGFNNGPLHPLSEIIRFNDAVATSNGVNVRPDLWIFPFLNVYAIFAKSNTSTAIDADVWLPQGDEWTKVMNLSTKANFDATTYGFGITPTGGIGGFFFALDMNFSWSDIDALKDPAYVFIFGPRIGKNIAFKKPDQSLALWTGGFRVKMNSQTFGSLNASELFPTSEWGAKVDEGYQKLTSSQQNVNDWWNGLSQVEQNNPVNKAKYETANRVLEGFGRVLDGASQVVDNAANASIQYSLEKRQKSMWNLLLGGQFQINRSWMIRAEAGVFGSRTQFIGGIQYRFDF